jgi:hypothetical protein
MQSISINYDLKWRHKQHHNYRWSSCGKLINIKTGRKIKKTVNGRSVGYWIKGKFFTLTTLRTQLEKIPHQEYTPF